MSDKIFETAIGKYRVFTVVSGRYKQNCYVILAEATRRALVIDPGGRAEDITRIAESNSDGVDAILLTHGHFDHLGAADELAERWAVPCHAHEQEKRLIRQAPLYALRFVKERLRAPRNVAVFESSQELRWNGTGVSVIACPGHTDGSVSYSFGGMVFTGDALLHEHIGPTFYPGSDEATLMTSIDRLLSSLDDDTVIFPGHGRPWTVGEAKAWWRDLGGPPPAYAIGQFA
jgi:glyoxylase-like metal-dependent hydrolase (beta-lactamase superfamily II)